MRVLVLAGAAAVLITELLSAFNLLRPIPLALAWLSTAVLWRRLSRNGGLAARPKWFEYPLLTGILLVLSIAAVVAAVSSPNTSDGMTYHLPRVVQWVQQGSVRFFPAHYFNQITLQPFAEYLILHTWLLTGGDRLANFVQYAGWVGSIVAVALIARELGASLRGQVVAAVLCATLPNAILQATGVKNELVLSLWLAAMVYFALRRQLLYCALALALALLTKATAYLFAPPLLIAVLGRDLLRARTLALFAAVVLAVNAPHYWRNFELSGSPLGYDSAHGDGFFRWRNERFAPGATFSNALRHLSEQLGGRSPQWNESVYRTVVAVHERLGIDPNDPASTWRWSHYRPPRNANHESDAPNRTHLLLFIAAASTLPWLRRPVWLLYGVALLAGFVLFCAYLKWQPFMARMLLPLFILACPLIAVAERTPAVVLFAGCVLLLEGTRLPLTENWTRPLEGPRSILRTPREDQYFADMTQFGDRREEYKQAARLIAGAKCDLVGIDNRHFQLEYPFQRLLLDRNPHVWFAHTGVVNASARYAAGAPSPCAVFCPGCAGNADRVHDYAAISPPRTLGTSVLFLRGQPAYH